MYDLNDAQPQKPPAGELIPDGTFAKIRLTIRPGGVDGATPIDAGLLTAAKSSDARMLDCELTVLEGPFARRKFWQNYTVSGGRTDDAGSSIGWNISKAAFRAMVDSALGLSPKDMSDATKAKRTLRGLKDLDGISFVARIMVEPPSDPRYSGTNKIANVVTADEPQYAAVLRGETVKPEPVEAKPRKPATPAAAQGGPAWATPAAPAGAASAPAWATPAAPAGAPLPTTAPAAAAAPAAPAPAPVPAAPAWATQPAPAAAPAPTAGPAWLNG